jgi:hypothetical protein
VAPAGPVSVAVSAPGVVYVANQGPGGSGYSGFRLHFDGSLTPAPGSTVTVPDGSGVGDVFFNRFGNVLIGARTTTSQIDSFLVLPGGRLLKAPGSPFTGQGLGQLGSEFSPTRPCQLFVSNAHNGTGLGTVSAYNDFFGQLSPIGPSPYPDGQTAPCWVEISHDGRYLFTVNTGSTNISSYSIKPGRPGGKRSQTRPGGKLPPGDLELPAPRRGLRCGGLVTPGVIGAAQREAILPLVLAGRGPPWSLNPWLYRPHVSVPLSPPHARRSSAASSSPTGPNRWPRQPNGSSN